MNPESQLGSQGGPIQTREGKCGELMETESRHGDSPGFTDPERTEKALRMF